MAGFHTMGMSFVFSCHWPLSIPSGNVRNNVNDGDTNKQTHGQSDQYKL